MSLTSLSALASVSGFVKGNPSIDYYKVLGFSPELVADFDDEYYRANRQKTTFDGLLTHSRLSNATMVDSDGLIKWGPHNLALNSASPATQSITVISGADYTVECTGVSVVLSGAGTGTVTEGNPVEITASTTTLTLTVTGSTGTMWCYRSDLGGMVNNPDTGNSYVPTTSSARYLPRRGHHVYNGSAWVNEGLLIETEARTNLVTQSENFATTWTLFDAGDTLTSGAATSPDGADSAYLFAPDSTSGNHILRFPFIFGALTYTISAFVKAAGRRYCHIAFGGASLGTPSYDYRRGVFDLQNGIVVSEPTDGSAHVEGFGNGWYRCSVTITVITATLANFDFYHADSATPTSNTVSDGNGTDGIYVFGAQLEAGSTPSSYIPTSGNSVNRTPDILTIPSAKLPWPTPKVIGPELVTNGTFDTDVSGWTDVALPSVWNASGYLDYTATAAGQGSYQEITTVSGRVYKATVDLISSTAAGNFRVGNGSTPDAGIVTAVISSGSSAEVYFVAQSASSYVYLRSSTAGDFSWDNISVREIDPLAVSIQMDGRMTYADTGDNDEVDFIRWSLDSSNRILHLLQTTGADTGQVIFRQDAAAVIDTAESATTTYSPSTLVPYNIASRHGSTFINGAVDGTALTANTTPVALPDLSSTDLSLAHDYMGTIRQFRVWAADLGDSGIEEASTNA